MGWFTNSDDNDNSNNNNKFNTFSSFSYNQQRNEVSCRQDPQDHKMSICVEKKFKTITGEDGKKKETVEERTFKRENGFEGLPSIFPSNILPFAFGHIFGDTNKQFERQVEKFFGREFPNFMTSNQFQPARVQETNIPEQMNFEQNKGNKKVYDL